MSASLLEDQFRLTLQSYIYFSCLVLSHDSI